MWSIDSKPDKKLEISKILPEEVLYYFDEPLIFTSKIDERVIISLKFDEEDQNSLYLCSVSSYRIINALKEGKISLRTVISQPWVWVIEADSNFDVVRTWRTEMSEIDEECLPEAHTGLYPSHGHVPDVLPNLSAEKPHLSVYFYGSSLGAGMPLGILKDLVEETYGSLKSLFLTVFDQYIQSGAITENNASRLLSIPVRPPQAASLSIEIDRPEVNSIFLKEKSNIDLKEIQKEFNNITISFLNELQDLNNYSKDRKEGIFNVSPYSFVLSHIISILPDARSSFEKVEISGEISPTERVRVTFDLTEGQIIRDAYRKTLVGFKKIQGDIIELSLRSDSFIIRRSDNGREVTCVASNEQVSALSLSNQRIKVIVYGDFENRKRRDKITVDKIELPDGKVIKRE